VSQSDFDVVIAGAGAAGLVAALAIGDDADVLLVEASETFQHGCNTAMSTAMIPAAGTRWQSDAGIDDSPELFFGDIVAKTKESVYEPLGRALADVSATVVTWLADDWDLPLQLVTDFNYPGHSVHRCHTLHDRSGRTLHQELLNRVRSLERVTFVVPMAIVDVHSDSENACEVIVSNGSAEEHVSAKAVILATNGFAASRGLVERYIPEIADGLYFGGERSMGDALAIGERLGADIGWLDAYQGHGSVATPHGVLVTWAVVMHGGVIVNRDGVRFDDETRGYSEYGARVLAQPEGRAWMIFDERVARLCRSFADYKALEEAHAIRWSATAEELMALTGCGPALATTLDDARAAYAGGGDSFGRTDWEAPLEPPFAAVAITGALFHTQGGVLVDGNARVLRGDRPILGVLAAGGAAVGISGHGASGYLAGNGLLGACGLGYLAGKEAVS
jgi:fumarate reductase flavoprotein subunit